MISTLVVFLVIVAYVSYLIKSCIVWQPDGSRRTFDSSRIKGTWPLRLYFEREDALIEACVKEMYADEWWGSSASDYTPDEFQEELKRRIEKRQEEQRGAFVRTFPLVTALWGEAVMSFFIGLIVWSFLVVGGRFFGFTYRAKNWEGEPPAPTTVFADFTLGVFFVLLVVGFPFLLYKYYDRRKTPFRNFIAPLNLSLPTRRETSSRRSGVTLSMKGNKLSEKLKSPSTLKAWSGFFRLDNTTDRSRRRADDAFPVWGALYAVIQFWIIPLGYGAAFFFLTLPAWASVLPNEWPFIANFVASCMVFGFLTTQTTLYGEYMATEKEGKMAPEGPDKGKQRPTLGNLLRYSISLFLVIANAVGLGYFFYESFVQSGGPTTNVLPLLIRYAAFSIVTYLLYFSFREAFLYSWRGRYIGTQMFQWVVLAVIPFVLSFGVNQFIHASAPGLMPQLSAGISILVGMIGYGAVAKVIHLQWPSETHKRGREESSYEKAQKAAARINTSDDMPGLSMGGLEVPWKDRTAHIAFIGTTGSGKTTQIRLLMQDALPLVGQEGLDQRALIYDAKLDAYSQLDGVRLKVEPITLNPFDIRSPGIKLSSDINNPASALQIATSLFYDRPGSNEFFTFTARRLGAGVLQSLILRRYRDKIDWTFSDWCRIMGDPEYITHVLNNTPETKKILKSLKAEETIDNVMSTIGSYMTHYEIIAALWDTKDLESQDTKVEPVSIREWANDVNGSILIMSRTDEATEAVDAINSVIFTLAARYSLARSNSRQRSTWFFLDEVAEGKKFPYLTKLALKGRSKGCCIVLGFQDIDGVRLTYGEREGNQISGLEKLIAT